ncbi:MAG TPA: hypothetical protein VII95_14570 [Terriglobales bacterium]
MKQNAVNRESAVVDNLTTERNITLHVTGVEEYLELPNDEQTGPALKRTVEDWLATKCKN